MPAPDVGKIPIGIPDSFERGRPQKQTNKQCLTKIVQGNVTITETNVFKASHHTEFLKLPCRVSTNVGKPDDRGCHEKISQAPKHFASKNTIKSLLLD